MGARRTGVHHQNRLAAETANRHDHLLVGSGVALGDFDSDGRADIYLARLEGPNTLYRNLGDWRFEDVTERMGVAVEEHYSTGAVFADVDGDFRLDLFVTVFGGPNQLFMNRAEGGFEPASESGLASELASTSATLADIDFDGDLDLYVANYKVESAADVLRPYEEAGLELLAEGADGIRVAEPYRDHFRVEMKRGIPVAVEQAEPDRLYLNSGKGTFTPVSWTDGRFLGHDGAPLGRPLDDFGLAAAFADVDSDGDPDLYVANDFDDPDQLWLNDGRGRFRGVGPFALRSTSHASMAVDFADVDRDGNVDFFVADMLSSDPARRLAQMPLHAPLTKPIGAGAERPQAGRNTLFLGRGDATWAQAADMAGLEASEWSWGSVFADVDLDGFEDLLVVNGHGRDMRDGDVFERIGGLRGSITWSEAKGFYPVLPTRNVIFRNRGNLDFEEVGVEWGFGDEADISHGIALGDLDGDGDLDTVVNRLGYPALLLRNDAVAPRIAVRLVGSAPNTAAIGAKVRLSVGDALPQEKEVRAGGLYLSASETLVSLAAQPAGMGDAGLELVVEWPGGGTRELSVAAGREYEIHQGAVDSGEVPVEGLAESRPLASDSLGVPAKGSGSSTPRPSGGGMGARAGSSSEASASSIFRDVSELLAGGHTHIDTEFEGVIRQPLLPWDLSRLGPGITWFDGDDDGDPDLYVPGGRGGRGVWLENGADGFSALPTPELAFDRTQALPEWNRAGGAGGRTALLVGQSSFEAPSPNEARALPSVVRLAAPGAAPETAVPGDISAAGPLAQADVDGDGDLDLFVGGRTVPAFYPLSATSRLLLRAGNALVEPRGAGVPDGANARAPGSFVDLAMVSGAVFTDLDDDGDPDLVLAAAWSAPKILLNDAGGFTDASSDWGVAALTGLWKGVTAGDLDGDGRMDLVLTNHGLNTELSASQDRPLWLVHGDLDRNGAWDLILARSRESGGALYPLERLERLRASVPAVAGRAGGFRAYASTPLEALMRGAETYHLPVTTLAHTLLLNRGDRFETRSLPLAAQLSPAHHAGIADLDGDGFEDVLITQNLYGTHGHALRHDSGRGLLLVGDGAGGLAPIVGSGIAAYGDGRGAAFADFDGDGRLDVAVGQHGGATRLYRNVGASRGLRVRLRGPSGNPKAIGAKLRIFYASEEGSGRAGPVREIRSGSGYWSHDYAEQIMGLGGEPQSLEVRWPDGAVSTLEIRGRWEVTLEHGGT